MTKADLINLVSEKAGITRLVKWFYARVRFDPLLEPIFNAHVPKWGEHLDLLIGQDADAGEVAVVVEEAHLLMGESVAVEVRVRRQGK